MKIVAITSCATGIAHSYMAAEAITKTAKKMGHQVKVEIQGAMGIENALSDADIQNADVIVFANDVGITKIERFINVSEKIIRTNPHEVIHHSELILEKASNLIEGR
jgi:fructose-specific phosphotransferase system IIB component